MASTDLEKRSASASIRSTEKLDAGLEGSLDQYDPELVRKTWWKVDVHIIPVGVILYLADYIDRCAVRPFDGLLPVLITSVA